MGDEGLYDGLDPGGGLGGSLMKDLLADLKLNDEDWLSLEQLEKDLQAMDEDGTSSENKISTMATPTAASFVVASQPSVSTAHLTSPPPTTVAPPAYFEPAAALDAWSISLQNFASSSLEKDFLQADSARKEEKKRLETRQPSRNPPGLPQLEEYDVNSSSVPPVAPPGLTPPTPTNRNLATQLPQQFVQQVEQQQVQHHNVQQRPSVSTPPPPPHISQQQPPFPAVGVVPAGYMAPPSRSGFATPPPYKSLVPPTPVSTPQNSFGLRPPPQQQQPVVVHTAVRGPAWQQQHHHAPVRIFCNPHPSAPPVAATAIASRFMPARDICYVVHSILRVILGADPKGFPEYHVQYWMRHLPGSGTTTRTARMDSSSSNSRSTPTLHDTELASRQARAKVWSTERKVLGATAKQPVTRPRALIAAPMTATTGAASEDRAALWKARLYCDRGYQYLLELPSTTKVMQLLFKCLGIQKDKAADSDCYVIDSTMLRTILKLEKGRTLLARTVEQYSVQVPRSVLPETLRILLSVGSTTITNPATDRLWSAFTHHYIAVDAPNSGDDDDDWLLDAIRMIMEHAEVALQQSSVLMLTHALLERANGVAQQNTSFAQRWKPTEEQFLQVLSGT